jgi:sphingomyelin phosphodiesterase acid-like 3
MKAILTVGVLRVVVLVCAILVFTGTCPSQPAQTDKTLVPALMISDIHFEPFWDPAKTAQLAAAPASAWKGILESPESADRAARFGALQDSCHARGEDTSYPLFNASLHGMHGAADYRFVTVSGDLIAHSFSCKFKTLFPQASAADYSAFVEKTIEYVVGSLRGDFPGVPVYAALGNNDSDCGDYQLDAHSDFLAATGKVLTADVPERARKEAAASFAAGGSYSVALPAPIRHTRLLVIDNLFMARKYAGCSGKPDPSAAAAQIAWLTQQLDRARRDKEKVWVMGHIPPGIDPYSTAIKGVNVCDGKEPQMYLSSEALADTLAGYGDVIRLVIFAHTHMDELRVLKPDKSSGGHGPVAVKMIPSISPIDGNNPSFTAAWIDPDTAVLTEYRVFAAPDKSGVNGAWAEEYDYARAYGEPSFSSSSVVDLIAEFKADPSAQSNASQSYLHSYFVGDAATVLTPFWPQYVCALGNHTESSYRECLCSGK